MLQEANDRSRHFFWCWIISRIVIQFCWAPLQNDQKASWHYTPFLSTQRILKFYTSSFLFQWINVEGSTVSKTRGDENIICILIKSSSSWAVCSTHNPRCGSASQGFQSGLFSPVSAQMLPPTLRSHLYEEGRRYCLKGPWQRSLALPLLTYPTCSQAQHKNYLKPHTTYSASYWRTLFSFLS